MTQIALVLDCGRRFWEWSIGVYVDGIILFVKG